MLLHPLIGLDNQVKTLDIHMYEWFNEVAYNHVTLLCGYHLAISFLQNCKILQPSHGRR